MSSPSFFFDFILRSKPSVLLTLLLCQKFATFENKSGKICLVLCFTLTGHQFLRVLQINLTSYNLFIEIWFVVHHCVCLLTRKSAVVKPLYIEF